ncbi:zf-HC2 domain-containing protein [Nonomuraea recticatena]|uniref:Putative zinc-finger domain-containing protein n=1 Tax=Nonomuraea recticatena TaxID=46178 RepID=A0ABN3R2I3_9ACTN
MHPEVAAYVLGVLDDADLQAFERHLDSCERCQRELKELQDVPDLLDDLKLQPSASEDDDPPISMSR